MPGAIPSGSVLSCHPQSDPSPRGRRRLVAVVSPRNRRPSGTRRPSPHPDPQLLQGRRRLVAVIRSSLPRIGRDAFHRPRSPPEYQGPGGTGPYPIPPPPSQPKTFWDETSQPLPAASITSGLETSRLPTSPAPTTPVISSGLPLPIPQPVFKTLKGFQTVAGGKAARPPPPVPCPQNVQPPPLAEGVGGGGTPEFPQAVSPDASRCSALPRRRNKPHRGSLPRANGACARGGPARFCVFLRALRACAPCREA